MKLLLRPPKNIYCKCNVTSPATSETQTDRQTEEFSEDYLRVVGVRGRRSDGGDFAVIGAVDRGL